MGLYNAATNCSAFFLSFSNRFVLMGVDWGAQHNVVVTIVVADAYFRGYTLGCRR